MTCIYSIPTVCWTARDEHVVSRDAFVTIRKSLMQGLDRPKGSQLSTVCMIRMSTIRLSRTNDKTAYSGELKLMPRNSNNVSNAVRLIKEALLRRISPRISYPPTWKIGIREQIETWPVDRNVRSRSISSEFCQLFLRPSVRIPRVRESSCEV